MASQPSAGHQTCPRSWLGVCAYPAPWASVGHSGFCPSLWPLRRFSPTGRESGGRNGSGFDLVLLHSISICQTKEKPITLLLFPPYRARVFQHEALLACRESGCGKEGHSELSCSQLSIRTRFGHSLILSLGFESMQSL